MLAESCREKFDGHNEFNTEMEIWILLKLEKRLNRRGK
jgi:hypothetical protein